MEYEIYIIKDNRLRNSDFYSIFSQRSALPLDLSGVWMGLGEAGNKYYICAIRPIDRQLALESLYHITVGIQHARRNIRDAGSG